MAINASLGISPSLFPSQSPASSKSDKTQLQIQQQLAGSRQATHQAQTDASTERAQEARSEESDPDFYQQQFSESLADFSRNVRQFANRRDLEKKGEKNNFERVLEEDAVPKAQKILQITQDGKDDLLTLLAQARSLFPDDSDLYLVLKELLRKKTLSELQRKRLQTLLKTVEDKTDPKKLKAGINCALKARLFGATLALQASLLRQTYRQFLEDDGQETETYKNWIATYGYKKRHLVLSFIEESLTIDIQSIDPSCSLMEFGNLLTRMMILRLLRSADNTFVHTLIEKQLITAHDEEEANWLTLMLALIDSDTTLDQLLFETLGQSALISDVSQRYLLLSNIKACFKQLPLALFEDEQIAEETLDAFDALLNVAYKKEQQYFHRLHTRPNAFNLRNATDQEIS